MTRNFASRARIARSLALLALLFLGTAEANFITISPVPVNGTVTTNVGGIVCGTGGAVCTSTDIAPGTSVTATATPDSGYQFANWVGIPSVLNPFTTLMPPANVVGSAQFSALPPPPGSVVVQFSPFSKSLLVGDVATFTVTVAPVPVVDTVVTIDAQPPGVVTTPPTLIFAAGVPQLSFPVTAVSQGDVTVSVTSGMTLQSFVEVSSTPIPPSAPLDVGASAGFGAATVSFDPPLFDGTSPITSYTATSSPGGFTASAATSPILISGLNNGTTYTFTVTATNSIGTGAPSASTNPVTPGGNPPDAPSGCDAEVSGPLTITVTCSPPVSDGGLPITSYTATSSPGGITATTGPAISFISIPVAGLTRGVGYTFTMTAHNAAGTSVASSPTVIPVTAATIPGAPAAVTAVGAIGTISVSWTAPADDGGAPITKYTVYSSDGKVTDVLGATNHEFVVLPGVPISFTVTATNDAGEGLPSDPSNTALALASPPDAPLRVHAMGGDGHATVSFLPPASSGGGPITAYVATASPGGMTASAAHSPITVDGLVNGSSYTFTVAAQNVAGTGSASAASNIVTPNALGPRVSAYAYVSSATDNLVAVIDTASNRVITTVPVGSAPVGVAVNLAGTRVYVANSGDDTVSVIDTATHHVVATISIAPAGAQPLGVAVNPAGSRVYVTNAVAQTVSVIDALSNTVLTAFSTGSNPSDIPYGIAVHPSGSPVFVVSGEALLRFDGTTNAAINPPATLGIPSTTLALAPGGGTVYVATGSTHLLSVAGAGITGDAVLANAPFGIGVSSTTGREYVSLPNLNSVVPIDGGVVGSAIPVGAQPLGVAVTPSGTRALVANEGDGTVSVINTANNAVVATIPVGNHPNVFGAFIGPLPASLPDAPGTPIATAGNAQATVVFLPPGNDGGAPITSYTATSSPGGITASAATSPILVNGLTNGQAYTFTVTATNAAGTGPASPASNSVTPGTIPGAPTSVSALSGDGQATVSFTPPASNGGFPITNYRVNCTPGPVIANGAASPIVVSGLVNLTQYSCTVSATNSAGTGPISAATSVTPMAASTTSLVPSASVLVAGATLTLTATVSGAAGVPTGTVAFHDGAASLGAQPLDGAGHAMLSTSALAVGSHSITATYSGSSTYSASTSTSVVVTIGSPDLPRLGNISTRMQVLTGDNVMIAGFIIGGSTPKTLAIVATGPSLVPFGITNPLANPSLTLVRQSDSTVIATNDDWQTAANAAALSATGFAPTNPLEAGLLVTLPPGAYTAIVQGSDGGTGVSVVGAFEIDHPEVPLINISTRGLVLTGDNVMIAGLIVQGSGPQTVVITATGPSLVPFGISNPLPNPMLRLVRQSDSTVIATNDDWQSSPDAAAISASGFAPTDPRESAIIATLDPGAYTAIVSGVGGGTGVSVVGVFTVH